MQPRAVSRRQFLKVAALGSATVGLGGGLGILGTGCGEAETTTTVPSSAITAAPTTATAGAEAGRDIRVGLVSPVTGFLASFSPPVKWQMERWSEAIGGGVIAGDGKSHKLVMDLRDTQSDSNRAAQVTADLISNNRVDFIVVAGSPDTVNPTADQCEALGTPCVATFVPWQAFYFGRGATPDKPFKWTYAISGGMEDIGGVYMDMWGHLSTNKKVAGIFPNNADGIAFVDPATGIPPLLAQAGYELVLPSLHQPGSEDYTSQISEFKKQGCELCVGAMATPDFANFWKQRSQQGFRPKAMSIALALLFPEGARSVGDLVIGCTNELVWHPSYPFKSSLSGENCQELAADYEKRTGNQWSPAIGQYVAGEWIVDSLKRAGSVDDKEALIQAVSTFKLDTMWGPIDFTTTPDMATLHPVQNVHKTQSVGGQWLKGTGAWPYEIVPVSNKFAPNVTLTAELKSL